VSLLRSISSNPTSDPPPSSDSSSSLFFFFDPVAEEEDGREEVEDLAPPREPPRPAVEDGRLRLVADEGLEKKASGILEGWSVEGGSWGREVNVQEKARKSKSLKEGEGRSFLPSQPS
jgi:hypothetical protein